MSHSLPTSDKFRFLFANFKLRRGFWWDFEVSYLEICKCAPLESREEKGKRAGERSIQSVGQNKHPCGFTGLNHEKRNKITYLTCLMKSLNLIGVLTINRQIFDSRYFLPESPKGQRQYRHVMTYEPSILFNSSSTSELCMRRANDFRIKKLTESELL